MAKRFEALVAGDKRFEIVTERAMGLVCFRLKVRLHCLLSVLKPFIIEIFNNTDGCIKLLKGENPLTRELFDRLMARKRIYLTAATYRDKLIIRFVVCSRLCGEKDIDFAWNEIKGQVDDIITANKTRLQPINGIEKSKKVLSKKLGAITATIEGLKIEEVKCSQTIS